MCFALRYLTKPDLEPEMYGKVMAYRTSGEWCKASRDQRDLQFDSQGLFAKNENNTIFTELLASEALEIQ